jgi:hypothetical protein
VAAVRRGRDILVILVEWTVSGGCYKERKGQKVKERKGVYFSEVNATIMNTYSVNRVRRRL